MNHDFGKKGIHQLIFKRFLSFAPNNQAGQFNANIANKVIINIVLFCNYWDYFVAITPRDDKVLFKCKQLPQHQNAPDVSPRDEWFSSGHSVRGFALRMTERTDAPTVRSGSASLTYPLSAGRIFIMLKSGRTPK
ncbi:hypothetical protein A3D03_01655 [Candidatus Gottesmanbacteria bacterium RIFCSPHIGHO2_02_FULL_40_13]|uniref:Uncharacterized protein n=1 Tax=Candidatus Gottesmanbacteria bacterium RIFCSPHIGHO2_02_FULL_40_13 TaxID=1798384 RepID=A0A1F6A796_9BACT|nr:MAG: hypothetical protein A3D03_01655 [Candidatus Gottesmanbacteria bacterium RIFCSPHIGHO2_02_FULL_40_13]